MPSVLPIGKSAERDIERRRALADSLSRSAVSTSPILSPLQGLAQLAQALASNSISRRAGKDEQRLESEKAKALADALSLTKEIPVFDDAGQPIQLPGSTKILEDPFPGRPTQGVAGDQVNIPGRFATQQVADQEGRLAALARAAPDQAAGIAGQVAVTEQLGQRGLLPGQIAAANRPPTALQETLGLAAQLGISSEAALDKLGAKNVTFLPDNGTAFEAMEIGGRLLDRDTLEPITAPGKVIRAGVQAENVGGLKPLGASESAKLRAFQVESKALLRNLGRLDELSRQTGTPPESFFANLRGGVSSFVANVDNVINTFVPRSAKQDASVQDYNSRRFNDNNIARSIDEGAYSEGNSEGYRSYTAAEQRDNFSAWQRFQENSVLDARAKAVAIRVAYTMARLADPGGRLSEMDVINQIRALSLDTGDPERMRAAIQEIRFETAATILDTAEINKFALAPSLRADAERIMAEGRGGGQASPQEIVIESNRSAEEDARIQSQVDLIMTMPSGINRDRAIEALPADVQDAVRANL